MSVLSSYRRFSHKDDIKCWRIQPEWSVHNLVSASSRSFLCCWQLVFFLWLTSTDKVKVTCQGGFANAAHICAFQSRGSWDLEVRGRTMVEIEIWLFKCQQYLYGAKQLLIYCALNEEKLKVWTLKLHYQYILICLYWHVCDIMDLLMSEIFWDAAIIIITVFPSSFLLLLGQTLS